MPTSLPDHRTQQGVPAINIVLIGAHPDDCEIKAGGTCAKWAKAGFRVVLVSMTNGDAGHQDSAGPALAERRKAEARLSADRAGVECLVLDNHDGQLQPTLAVREEVVRIIRRYEADVVITHRPNDYHPDHRYTSQVVQDSAYMVTVPAVCPDTPALRRNPVFLYFMDFFQKPLSFSPDIGVIVDDTMPVKWQMLDAMESQMYEWLAWHDGLLADVPKDPGARLKWLRKTWGPRFERAANEWRKALSRAYGKEDAAKARFAEFFEISEYGSRPSPEGIHELFPFLPRDKKRGKKS